MGGGRRELPALEGHYQTTELACLLEGCPAGVEPGGHGPVGRAVILSCSCKRYTRMERVIGHPKLFRREERVLWLK